MQLHLEGQPAEFQPGQTVRGRVVCDPGESIEQVELAFVWQTFGKGTTDQQEWPAGSVAVRPGQQEVTFTITAPHRPFSLSGKLLSIRWSLQATARPSGRSMQLPISISPTGQAVALNQSYTEMLEKRSVVRVGTRK